MTIVVNVVCCAAGQSATHDGQPVTVSVCISMTVYVVALCVVIMLGTDVVEIGLMIVDGVESVAGSVEFDDDVAVVDTEEVSPLCPDAHPIPQPFQPFAL